jgi:hypothetical protein
MLKLRVYKLIDINTSRVYRLATTTIVDQKAKIRNIDYDRRMRWCPKELWAFFRSDY